MPREVINVPGGPLVPASPAVRAGDFIFLGGQPGTRDPRTGRKIENLEGQIKQSFERTKEVLATAGASLADVVKVTVYLRNPADFVKMNEIYGRYFPKTLLPARVLSCSPPSPI